MKATTTEVVAYDDVKIETYVDGNGPTLVIIPSYGRDGGKDYDVFTQEIVKVGFKVIRPQPRGIAGSTGPMDGITLHDLAADVVAAIRRLGDGSAIVLGHAYGNFIARMIATDAPEVVRGVILASSQANKVSSEINDTPAIMSDMQATEKTRTKALKLGFFAPGNNANAWMTGWYPKTFKMQHNAVGPNGTPSSEFWDCGEAKVLEVIPDHDPFKPKDSWGEMKQQMGDRVTTVVIKNASHALFPEQPAEVAKQVLPWMQELG